MMTVLEEMGAVIRATPGPSATPTELAHWYELKASLLEHIAHEDRTAGRNALRQADAAHRRAASILATSGAR